MLRIVREQFGGDAALADKVREIALSATEAIDILAAAADDDGAPPARLDALEAVVAFDGSRPSFLLREDRIDYESSYNAGTWQRDLARSEESLVAHAACVGRVERDGTHLGTAFLVTPTLAITNRHVAQALAAFSGGAIELDRGVTIDFGREGGSGRQSWDSRTVEGIAFAGSATVKGPIDHERLDLAVLRLTPSALPGAERDRRLAIGGVTSGELAEDSRFLVAIGYPADPKQFVPTEVWTEYGAVIRRLLEGEGGHKRLAPGQPMPTARDGLTEWTATHDATTMNGNSGSPLLKYAMADGPRAAGLHYGGRSGGDRVNWAHLLHYAADKPGYGTTTTFGEFCRREGIALG